MEDEKEVYLQCINDCPDLDIREAKNCILSELDWELACERYGYDYICPLGYKARWIEVGKIS
jgi:hypothetical protein